MSSNTKLDAERELFEAAFEQDEFRREYAKYGPMQAAWAIWQAARSLPAQASEPVAICDKCHGKGELYNSRGHHYGKCDCTGPAAVSVPAQASEPASDTVSIPANADQAVAMALMGMHWLEKHAPDRLKPAVSVPAQGEIAKKAARLLDAARTYANNHLRDQLNDARECINSDTQWFEVRELFAAIAAMSSQPGKGEA